MKLVGLSLLLRACCSRLWWLVLLRKFCTACQPALAAACSPLQCVDKSPAEAQRSSAGSIVEVLKAMH